MDPTTWTPRRALVFARGLYHVAACDGLDPREVAAIEAFCARARLTHAGVGLEQLAAEPFDFAEAAEALDSPWLRRVFVDACRWLVQLDGRVSGPERDALRAVAAALGVGEAAVLVAEPVEPVPPEALVEWIAGLAVDLVAWDDESRPAIFWDFPHPTHPLADGGTLRVEHAQSLVVHLDGEVTDVLGPGRYRLTRDALPGLAVRGDWRDGRVRARLTYVTTGPQPLWRWGTAEAIPVTLPDGPQVPVRAFGRYALRLVDPAAAFARFARQGAPSVEDFRQRTARMLAGRFAVALARLAAACDDVAALLADAAALSAAAAEALGPGLRDAGLELRRFHVENVTAPLEMEVAPGITRSIPLVQAVTASRPVVSRATGTREVVRLSPCPECLAPVPTTARFCPKCGTARRRACTGCGEGLPPNAKFCSECGARA